MLVVHNGARFLESQTRSILNQQTLPDVMIYLVDDCSNDRSVAIGQELVVGNACLEIVNRRVVSDRDVYRRIAANFSAVRLGQSQPLVTDNLSTNSIALSMRPLRDRSPILSDWRTATPRARLESILRSPTATGAAMMTDRELTELALANSAWLVARSVVLDRVHGRGTPGCRRPHRDQIQDHRSTSSPPAGLVNKAAWRHALEAVKSPANPPKGPRANRAVRDAVYLSVEHISFAKNDTTSSA